MGDEDDRKEFVDSNLLVLTKSTVIGIEFVVNLLSKGLVDKEEMELLTDGTPNIRRAALLYTRIANKWSQSQFENFKIILRDTGNHLALQVFTSAGADVFLTNDQVQLLRDQINKSGSGCYEGLSQGDEVKANRLIQIVRGEGNSSLFSKDTDGKFRLSLGLQRKEVVPLVKHFENCIKNGIVWWNPRKPRLPLKYVERSVGRTQSFRFDRTLPTSVQPRRLKEIVEESSLVLIVDPPGMGKSSEMSDVESKLRMKVPTNRVILRVNLNEVQRTLATLSPSESASSVLLKLASFIPANILSTVGVRVFVLLDGLDEVCPKHKDTMINLLRIFTSQNEPTLGKKIRVVVTTRPHLRETVEKEFQLESWSLLPLTEKQQDEYMKSVLGVSDAQLSEFRGKLTRSVADLLSNPLMLSMFVESEGTFSGGDELNIFELYTKYVDSKHKLQLVEKEGMRAEDNYTEMRLDGMLEKNLPHYYHVAIRELIYEYDNRTQKLIFRECEGSGLVAQDEPSGVTRDELLSIGLLVEGSKHQLIFKHRSFAEFFYARLLTQEDSAPQIVRDILFHCIYRGNRLENVESFLVGASPASLSLSSKWLLLSTNGIEPAEIISEFAGRYESLPFLVREVLLSFVQGDPDDLWEAHRIIFDQKSRIVFAKLFNWMNDNREWTREQLLKLRQITTSTAPPSCPPVGVANEVPQATARLILFIALHFEGQELLSEEEVGVAVNSCDHRILYVVAQFQTERSGWSKWEWVEGRLFGGASQLKTLFLQMDDADLRSIIKDRESACKLVSTLSHEEISALVSSNETRVSDIIGEKPVEVIVALGEEFIPRGKQLAEFRGKFGRNKEKTVFEMEGGCEFALKYLWDDLVREVGREDASGPVGVALREALSRYLLWKLEYEVRQRVGLCRRQQKRKHSEEKVDESGAEDLGVKVMDWVTRGLRWSHTPTLYSLKPLPFLLRYWDNTLPTLSTNLLQHQLHFTSLQNKSEDLMAVLRSLVIVSSLRSHDNEDSSLFSILTAFLRENLHKINPQFRSLTEVFFGATRTQIATAASSPLHLVQDVSVGGVALNLLTTQQPAANLEKDTLKIIVVDVIQFVPCCDLPTTLQQLCRLMEEQNQLELLKEILTSADVLEGWKLRLSSTYRREGNEDVNVCGVRKFLSFYFSIFGLNCNWMRLRDEVEVEAKEWTLVGRLPVEISCAVRGNPHWTHLLPQFQLMLSIHLRAKKFPLSLLYFSYTTEREWETLLALIDGETFLPVMLENYPGIFPAAVAAPLIGGVIKLHGVEWTKSKLTKRAWDAIRSNVEYTNTDVGSLGALLHSAIELGELEEVKKRAWPGVVSWRDGEGKTALQLATEKYDERHPIRIHLDNLNFQ